MDEHYKNIAKRIRGPLAPIMVPLKENDEIDHDALGKWINWMADEKIPVFWMTAGTTEMRNGLSEAEVFAVTKTVAEANRGRSFFIAGTPGHWPVAKCIEYVRFAKQQGADAAMPHLDWNESPTNDDVERFYGAIAESSDLPLLAYTLLRPGLPVDLMVKLIQRFPQFVGIKNDTDDLYTQTAYLTAAPPEFAAITGGMQRPFLLGSLFGQKCYADSFAMYAPYIAKSLFDHVVSGHLGEAVRIIKQYEFPMAELTFLGKHRIESKAMAKTILWLTGHFPTNRVRFPLTTLKPDGPEVVLIRQFLDQVRIPIAVKG